MFPGLRKRSWKRWTRMDYLPAVKRAGRPGLNPSLLCHTFGSLMIQDGKRPSEVARLMGIERSDAIARYWYVLDETPASPRPATSTEQIRAARAAGEAAAQGNTRALIDLSRLMRALVRPAGSELGWAEALGVRALSVETVERIRSRLLSAENLEEATFVSVMAYAGVNQSEARQLKWREVKDGYLELEGISDGCGSEGARRLRQRTVPLFDPLANDLAEWHRSCGSPERGWVFPGMRKGNWQEWVLGDYRRAAKQAGAENTRPHYLSHTFCGLLIDEQVPLEEVARQMALTPKETLIQYGHLFEEAHVEERAKVSASIRITAARRTAEASERSFLGRMLRKLRSAPGGEMPAGPLPERDAA
jgi:integrase